jgi:hypothetical protein
MAQHRRGGRDAAHILVYLKQRRIGWRVVRIWPGGGLDLEDAIKQAGHYDRLCPVCSGEAALRRGNRGYETQAVNDDRLTNKRPRYKGRSE